MRSTTQFGVFFVKSLMIPAVLWLKLELLMKEKIEKFKQEQEARQKGESKPQVRNLTPRLYALSMRRQDLDDD